MYLTIKIKLAIAQIYEAIVKIAKAQNTTLNPVFAFIFMLSKLNTVKQIKFFILTPTGYLVKGHSIIIMDKFTIP